jgi:hypothetical protein
VQLLAGGGGKMWEQRKVTLTWTLMMSCERPALQWVFSQPLQNIHLGLADKFHHL